MLTPMEVSAVLTHAAAVFMNIVAMLMHVPAVLMNLAAIIIRTVMAIMPVFDESAQQFDHLLLLLFR